MPKNYTWHLVCETHEIDEWLACQTTGNDAESSQKFIQNIASTIKGSHSCQKTNDNLIELVEEKDVE